MATIIIRFYIKNTIFIADVAHIPGLTITETFKIDFGNY